MTPTPTIAALLDEVAAENTARMNATPAMSRAAAEAAIAAILWAHGCRSTDTASIYAMDALYRALGVDLAKSTLAWLPVEEPPA